MTRIRLCMAVNNLDVGGLERFVISLLRHLPRSRFEPSLVCLSGEGKLFSEIDLPSSACLVLDKDPVVRGGHEWTHVPVHVARIVTFLRERRIDVLNVHNLAPLIYAGTAARLLPRGPRVVYTEHNQIHRARERARRKFREYSRLAHEIVTVSHDLRRKLVEDIRVPRPVRTLHNGIDGSSFSGAVDTGVRRELGIDDGTFVFGSAAVLSVQKGVTHLLDAAKIVLGEEPSVRFAIAGDGPLRDSLEAKARALGLTNVRFIGYRSDIPAFIASCDGYVLPSLWEGLPLALLEALAHGLPIVASRVGGAPEVVEHGVNGFLVPAGDAERLAEHLVLLVRDRDLRERMRRANAAKFRAQFDIHAATIPRYVRLYEEHMRARACA